MLRIWKLTQTIKICEMKYLHSENRETERQGVFSISSACVFDGCMASNQLISRKNVCEIIYLKMGM